MAQTHNTLIRLLPPVARTQLLARCEPVSLAVSQVLSDGLEPLSHAYFPMTGFVSLTVQVDAHPGIEVGTLGSEGMLGSELLLDTQPMPWHVVVQLAGHCLQVETARFRALAAQFPALQAMCHGYLMVRLQQMSRSAACVRFHAIGPRLARWLLICHDHAQTSEFKATQAFLALMLGVKRGSVTTAASELQRQGLIAYQRGVLTVLDRVALAQAACSCHRADQAAYEQFLSRRQQPSQMGTAKP